MATKRDPRVVGQLKERVEELATVMRRLGIARVVAAGLDVTLGPAPSSASIEDPTSPEDARKREEKARERIMYAAGSGVAR